MNHILGTEFLTDRPQSASIEKISNNSNNSNNEFDSKSTPIHVLNENMDNSNHKKESSKKIVKNKKENFDNSNQNNSENKDDDDDDDEYEEEDIESFQNYNEDQSFVRNNYQSKTNTKIINSTFYITYAFLMTTATITFIEAIRTKDEAIRNILNLETCISIVATFFYGKFVDMLKEDKVEYDKINYTRYLDWSITTPVMLLVLVLALLYNSKMGSMNFLHFIVILLLNYGMIGSGYLGEIKMLDKLPANIIGFVFFIAMYFFIYYMYLKPSYNFDNYILYFAFLILWAIYGIVYFADEVTKNVAFNILDLLSKCFVGIFFWAYYTKVFTL